MEIKDFNPRSREGSDGTEGLWKEISKISTHAPARGATKCGKLHSFNILDFNPRSREGSDEFPPLCQWEHK